jgi:hypothetical protein
MILQNTTSLVSVTLPRDLQWVDEHNWSPVIATAEYSLTGALIVESATRQAGQPISLEPPDESMAWVTRTIVNQLYAWSAIAGQTFTLTLDDARVFTVMFRHQEPPAMEASPVRKLATYDPEDFWTVKLKLMRV